MSMEHRFLQLPDNKQIIVGMTMDDNGTMLGDEILTFMVQNRQQADELATWLRDNMPERMETTDEVRVYLRQMLCEAGAVDLSDCTLLTVTALEQNPKR